MSIQLLPSQLLPSLPAAISVHPEYPAFFVAKPEETPAGAARCETLPGQNEDEFPARWWPGAEPFAQENAQN